MPGLTRYIKSFKFNKDIFLDKAFWALIFISIFLITIALSTNDYSHEIVSGTMTLLIAGIAAWMAIDKYHQEQRVSRIQKLYFEESFLGQIKAMEETMSHITKNFKHIRAIITGIHAKADLPVNFLKKSLLEQIGSAEKNMGLNFTQTDFKKETISYFFYKAKYYHNKIPNWIKQFEDDAFYFQNFLDVTLISCKILLLDELNSGLPSHAAVEKILNNLNRHYLLVERHYILFTLLSEVIFELSNESYSSINAIIMSFQEHRYKSIIQLSDEAYKNLIEDFSFLETISNNVFIDENTEKKLRDRIDSTKRKIQEILFPKNDVLTC